MTSATKPLLNLQLRNELDVVLAQKRTRDLAQLAQLSAPAQTKFATAVSEICRNVIEHVGLGEFSLGLLNRAETYWLEAVISDRGRGIGNPEMWLTTVPRAGQRGCGLYNAKRLADDFDLRTDSEKGTQVTLRQRVNDRHLTLSPAVVLSWRQYLTRENDVSPYEELKGQNQQLVQVYEELQQKNQLAEQQIAVISRLNYELEKLNAANEHLLREREERNIFLQHINAELDAFAHTVSHDLKSPLYNIEGLTHLIEDSLASQDLADITHSVMLLRQQTTWMNRLIHGILNYARAGRHGLLPEPVNVANLLAAVVRALPVPDGLQIHISPQLPVLLTEEIYIQQVFSNLIGNALKYHDRPVAGNVWVTARQESNWLEFSVADDGPGIPSEDQATLFQIFQVTHSRATVDSTGVGLAIVRKIVHDKGGRVWIESAGRGSRFSFTWPVQEIVTPPVDQTS